MRQEFLHLKAPENWVKKNGKNRRSFNNRNWLCSVIAQSLAFYCLQSFVSLTRIVSNDSLFPGTVVFHFAIPATSGKSRVDPNSTGLSLGL